MCSLDRERTPADRICFTLAPQPSVLIGGSRVCLVIGQILSNRVLILDIPDARTCFTPAPALSSH
jgi:hypothetical protein